MNYASKYGIRFNIIVTTQQVILQLRQRKMGIFIKLTLAEQKRVRLKTRIEMRQLWRLFKGSRWSQKL